MNNFQQPGNTNTLQMPESVKYFGDSVSNSVESVSGSITDSVNQFSDSTQASVDTTLEGSSDFLQSNTLFAKSEFFQEGINLFALTIGCHLSRPSMIE